MDVLAGTGCTIRIAFEDEFGVDSVPDAGSVSLVLLDMTGQPYVTASGQPYKFPLVDGAGVGVVQGTAQAPSLPDLGVSSGVQLPDGIQEIPVKDSDGNVIYVTYGPISGQPT